MKEKLVLLGTVAALTIAAASQSTTATAHNNGWYIGVEGGAAWVDDNDGWFGLNSGPAVFAETTSFDTGWAVLATIGYGFESRWRIEFEAGYRSNDIDAISLPAFAGFGPFNDGDLTEITLMANVLYDVPLSDRLDLTVGLGAGGDRVEFQTPSFWGGSDDQWQFAYQAIAGLSYALTDRLDLTLQYRYLVVDEPEFAVAGGPISATPEHWNFEDLEKHTVTIGLRYDLAPDEMPAPPAPPVAPPLPPAAVQQFVIYFGFNKCNITAEADQVLSEAANAAKTQGTASISIVGHTDTVGSNKYNQRLSECRANAAKSNLTGRGIPSSAISTTGRGESELLVQTGDNVKEPQNRRATIDLD